MHNYGRAFAGACLLLAGIAFLFIVASLEMAQYRFLQALILDVKLDR